MADPSKGPQQPATRLVTGGRRPEWTGDPRLGGSIVNPPLWRASTILYDSVAAMDGRARNSHDRLFYGRRGTPTVWALADALTALEPGAEGTLLYPSGVAAIAAALTAMLSPGDHLLMVDSVYDPTRSLCDGLLKRMGIATTYYPPGIGAGIAALVRPETRLIFLESPGSLTFEVQDVPAITGVARAHGIASVMDNTWATPLLFRPLDHGVDVSMTSLTKYVGGHSDAMMGSLTVTPAWWERLRHHAYQTGQCVSADDTALVLRGLRTLDVRMARHSESALAIANWLDARDEVGEVRHPALPQCPGHAHWARDFSGASGLFAFTLKGCSTADRGRFIDALSLFGIGYSWGGYESLVVPADPPRSAEPWTGDPMVRLSVGLEDAGDLVADLARAFDVMAAG